MVVQFIKASHRADFDAIRELAVVALAGNDVGHSFKEASCVSRRLATRSYPKNKPPRLAAQPFIPVFGDKLVVVQVWVSPIYPIDFRRLARTEGFFGIKTPVSFKQALAA